MKIVMDTSRQDDVESHARFLHEKMLTDYKLPRISAVTRALVPGWCDACEGRAWSPIFGGPTLCTDCRGKDDSKSTGF